MSAEVLLSRLEKVKSRGEHKWMACCPAHEDRDPSLAIAELSDGRVLVKCFAGCGAAEIMSAVRLSMTDLMPKALGEFRSFMAMGPETGPRFKDKAILELADAKRRSGERLTPQELQSEREAYLRVRHAND